MAAKKNELTGAQWTAMIVGYVTLAGALVWALFYRTPATE